MQYAKNLNGHTERITKFIIIKNKYIVSLGSETEIFLWEFQGQNILRKFKISSEPNCICDIYTSSELFIIEDLDGKMHIMDIGKDQPIKSLDIFEMTVSSLITYIVASKVSNFIASGNS